MLYGAVKMGLIDLSERSLYVHKMALGNRIRAVRGQRTQRAFAEALGVSVQAVSQWETGKTAPTHENLAAMAQRFRAELDWLIRGEEEDRLPAGAGMLAESSVDSEIGRATGSDILEIDVRAGAGGGGQRRDAYVSDGRGNVYAAEHIRDHWSLPDRVVREMLHSAPRHTRAFEVIGDSMEPRLHSGDRVFVDTRDTLPNPEGIFVLWDGYSLVVKRIQIVRGSEPLRLRVISANPDYPPYEAAIDEVKIIGRYAGRFTVS
jgi:phage repressor protein C with HTH and peptisase S24 domain